MAQGRGSDRPTSPRAVLDHTDANLCTILHTTVFYCTQNQLCVPQYKINVWRTWDI